MENYVKNVWEFQVKELSEQMMNEKLQRDQNLINRFFKYAQLQKISNMCFNACVNNFNDSTLQNEEVRCLSTCKETSLNFIFDNKFPDTYN